VPVQGSLQEKKSMRSKIESGKNSAKPGKQVAVVATHHRGSGSKRVTAKSKPLSRHLVPQNVQRALAPLRREIAQRLTSKEMLQGYLKERKNILQFVKSHLKDGIDYGHTAFDKNTGKPLGRPCLKKPGSEKICIYLRLDPIFIVDQESWLMLGSPQAVLIYICFLMTKREKREALRQMRVIGKEHEQSIYHLLCVAEGRGAYTVAQTYKGAEHLNTVVKMAQKSAQVDATLRIEGLSEIFDQDTVAENGDRVDLGNHQEHQQERNVTASRKLPVALPENPGIDNIEKLLKQMPWLPAGTEMMYRKQAKSYVERTDKTSLRGLAQSLSKQIAMKHREKK
jgi:hypothetical protein